MISGDYIRIVRGNRTYIRRIKSIYKRNAKAENTIIVDKPFEGCRYTIQENKVLESNPKITKLVKEGDYVNGFKVVEIMESKDYDLVFISYRYNGSSFLKMFDEEAIETIITKEQYEYMQYFV